MPTAFAALVLICPLLVQSASLSTLESIVDEAVLDEKGAAPLASPGPFTAPDAAPEPVITASLLEPVPVEIRVNATVKLLSKSLEPHHKARALSHSAQSVCFNDCPPHPQLGSLIDDNFCDDGAPSIEYCLDPTGVAYPCTSAQFAICPFGHDCADCTRGARPRTHYKLVARSFIFTAPQPHHLQKC